MFVLLTFEFLITACCEFILNLFQDSLVRSVILFSFHSLAA